MGKVTVQQNMKQDSDINDIVQRNAVLSFQNRGKEANEGFFADVSEMGDFRAYRTRIARINEKFNSLPSYIRRRFDNDPARLIDFLNNKENRKEAEKLGLVKKIELPVIETPKPPEPGKGSSDK